MTKTVNHQGLFAASLYSLLRYKSSLLGVFAIVLFALSANQARAANYDVINYNDSGAGSLRQAILDANAAANSPAGTPDEIRFVLSSGTINLATPLPPITDSVNINTAGNVTIELNGMATQNAGAASIGLYIRAGGCLVRGLAINRFGAAGIRMDTDGAGNDNGNILVGNYVGTDAASNAGIGNINRGILIVGTTGHRIGGLGGGGNVISGNQGNGIEISGNGSATILGNMIGVNSTAISRLLNTGSGILIASSSGSIIGGVTGTNPSLNRNIISGNGSHGISIIGDFGALSSNNTILNNHIGVDGGGNNVIPNDGSGIVLEAATNNTIGTTSVDSGNPPAPEGNVISGNRGNGISISSSLSTGNVVIGNNIGVGRARVVSIPNRLNGIQISSNASGNRIGGADTTPGACNNSCNVIANNAADDTAFSARAGVYVDVTAGVGNAIRGNSIFNNGNPPVGNPPNGLGIDLGAVGTTPNDTGDSDTGANDLQNFPVITTANTAFISGRLNSTPNTTFAIDFYGNTDSDGAMSEGRTFIGSLAVTTDGSGNSGGFSFSVPASTLTVGQIVTATATSTSGAAQAIGDTSEFSAVSNSSTVIDAPPTGGFEGDISPRPNGDTSIDADDIQQIRRFSVGLDLPYQSNEFQRTDCSPRSISGDGILDADDIQQVRRYSVGLDMKQVAGGPTNPAATSTKSLTFDNWKRQAKSGISALATETRIEDTTTSGNGDGQVMVTVPIRVDASGNEAGLTFSLSYDGAKLSNPVVSIGTVGGNVLTNITPTNPNANPIGFSIDSFAGGTLVAGSNQLLVTVRFTVAAGAAGETALRFGDGAARRKVSAADPNALHAQASFTDGTLTISAPARRKERVKAAIN